MYEVLHALYFKDDKYRKLVKLFYESPDKTHSSSVFKIIYYHSVIQHML